MIKYRKSNSVTFGPGPAIAFLIVLVLGVIGWILNILHILDKAPFVLDGATVLQIIGVFMFPLGALLGWIL